MREILFRGKRIDNGEWEYGNLEIFNGCVYHIVPFNVHISTSGIPDCVYYDVDSNTIGQYTGLNANGTKVFEGDIIKIVPDYDYSDDYSISKVYSYNGVFCVDYHGDDFDSTALGFLEDYLPDGDFEVIGNIYDDPELLEVEE